MKSYRNALCASVLLLALASSAFAGDIQHPVAPPPPTATSGEAHTGPTDGVIEAGEAESASEADALMEIALNLLQSVLTLL